MYRLWEFVFGIAVPRIASITTLFLSVWAQHVVLGSAGASSEANLNAMWYLGPAGASSEAHLNAMWYLGAAGASSSAHLNAMWYLGAAGASSEPPTCL